MARIVALTNVTLDGVMQAPGRPDEDLRGGFASGGWATPYAAMQYAGGSMANSGGLLLGRRTYEDFYSVWPRRTESPYSAVLDNTQKYVASTTLRDPLPWQNSTLLGGNAADGVAHLRQTLDRDLVILGSGALIQSLMLRGLIDEFVVLIHPLVLGTGRRLFGEGGAPADLQLIDSTATPTGVVVATYHPHPGGAPPR